ncbi:MAG: PAS domain S-box protein [Desulfobacteraceae bacterium]|nr:MAG: PAS domain S-box protein [Desulfobacteraceae bacterium]
MEYKLQDLIDIEHFQDLQDRLNAIYSFPSSIIDNDGNILTATAWQEVCTQFHRRNKDAEKVCIKSDQYIKDHIHEANPAVTYHCPHGLVDNAIPIIIDGIHYGNFFTGQFFLEKPNITVFRTQAHKYGFNEEAYLKAVEKVPIWTQEQLDSYLFFIKGLISVISESGLKRLKEMENRKQIQKSEKRYRSILKATMDGYWLTNTKGQLLEVNDAYCRMSGYSESELLAMRIPELEVIETPEMVVEHMQKVIAAGSDRFETKHRRKDGSIIDVEISLQFRKDEGGQCICFLRDITDRKKAEVVLRKSEKRFKQLAKTAFEAIVIHDQGVVLEANDQYFNMFGYEREELIGKEGISRTTTPESHRIIQQQITKGSLGPYTATGKRKDGTVFPMELRVLNMEYDGRDVRAVAIRDLTEQKIAEDELRKNESYMRSIFRAAPAGIGVVHNRIMSQVNDKFCEMLGYSQDELIGQNSRMIYFTDEEYERVGREKYEQIRQSGTGTVETQMKCKDGKKIDVLLSSTPIEDDDLNAGVTFTTLDITSIKHTQTALKNSEMKYRTMMEAIKDPVYICSDNYRIQYMNQAMLDRVGHDATGELCYEALHGFDRQCLWCKYDHIFKSGHTEKNIVSPLDNRSFNVSSTVFENETGSLSKLSVFRDTTDFIELQNRLQQAQKMEAIGNLAGGIAHDFNNILFPIIGRSELMMEDLAAGSLELEHAHEIYKAGHRAKGLVSQILSFSRQSDQETMPIKFQSILKEVLKLCRSSIPTNIEIEQEIWKDCGPVRGNATQLHQIGLNLITNAYHAVQEKNGKIKVALEEITIDRISLTDAITSSGKYLQFTVSDDGVGMTEKVKNKIFEPYFTTKEQGKGTGLGLAVVYGIVKEYGGEVEVETKVGSGTTFKVYLPLINDAEKKDLSEVKNTFETGDEHILLVDDEDPVIRLEKQILERLGYKVTSRLNSIEALESFKNDPNQFDLVITDMSMPNLTGVQLAKEMLSINPDTPIIICTGFSERINKEKAENIGVKGFLMKPVIKSDMAQMVRKVLDESKDSDGTQ